MPGLKCYELPRRCLPQKGGVLIVTNFANTRFRDWESEKRATTHLDGYLLRNSSGTSFYGMIPLEVLHKYCKKVGLAVQAAGTFHGECAWVFAEK
jgi:hypothetical protein